MGKNQALTFSPGKDLVTNVAMQSYRAVVTGSFLMGSLFDLATRPQFPFGVYHLSHNLNIKWDSIFMKVIFLTVLKKLRSAYLR